MEERQRVFQSRPHGNRPVYKERVLNIPISYYSETVESDGSFFHYLFPMGGIISHAKLLVDEASPDATVEFTVKGRGVESSVLVPITKGIMSINAPSYVNEGERAILSLKSGTARGFWIAFVYKMKAEGIVEA